MQSGPLVSTLDTLILLECLQSHNVSSSEIFASTGVDSARYTTMEFEIPLTQLIRLWQMAADVSGDPAIGIHLRQRFGSNFFHFVNHIGINSRNVGEALRHYTRYGKLMGDCFSYQLTPKADQHVFSFSINSPAHQNPWIPEYHLSLISYFARLGDLPQLKLEEVRFRHPLTGDLQPYTDFFGAPVYFDQNENAFDISNTVMNVPIHTHDPHLQAILKKQADATLANHPRESEFLVKIEAIILENLGAGNLDAELVAGKLDIHRSTLHRRLRECGTSFKELLAKTRKDLAGRYLQQGMSIGQIAFLLGYSSRSNFQVAFKSWFGRPPGKFKSAPSTRI